MPGHGSDRKRCSLPRIRAADHVPDEQRPGSERKHDRPRFPEHWQDRPELGGHERQHDHREHDSADGVGPVANARGAITEDCLQHHTDREGHQKCGRQRARALLAGCRDHRPRPKIAPSADAVSGTSGMAGSS